MTTALYRFQRNCKTVFMIKYGRYLRNLMNRPHVGSTVYMWPVTVHGVIRERGNICSHFLCSFENQVQDNIQRKQNISILKLKCPCMNIHVYIIGTIQPELWSNNNERFNKSTGMFNNISTMSKTSVHNVFWYLYKIYKLRLQWYCIYQVNSFFSLEFDQSSRPFLRIYYDVSF